jgi:hypothetical protein
MFFFSLLTMLSFSAMAHKPSDSYLSISNEAQQSHGQWDIALRDLETAIGLDTNNDGEITWQELHEQQAIVTDYVLNRLVISNTEQLCVLNPTDFKVDEHSDGHYAVVYFKIDCPNSGPQFNINYQLFFDFDRQHRGLLKLNSNNTIVTHIFSPEQPDYQFNDNTHSQPLQELLSFSYEGLQHIWKGYDHILFLLSLILPAALTREYREWQAKLTLRSVFTDVLKIVSAFTLAHSITLSLTALHYIVLPSRWIESAIAASVVLAALNNIFPRFMAQRTWFAFGFGLIHGMGIAGVLLDLGLPDTHRLYGLLGFNLGVEAGQMLIVSALLPLIIVLSRRDYYAKYILKPASSGIMTIGMIWLLERSLDFQV